MNGKLTALQRQYLSRLGKAEVEQPTLTGDLLSDLVFGWSKYTNERLKQSLLDSKLPGNPTSGRASKSLYSSLKVVPVTRRGDIVVGAISANDYYEQVDKGRGPTRGGGKGDLVKALAGDGGWISEKGISVKNFPGETDAEKNLYLAKAIARKIHAKGYRGNKFFSKIITDTTFEEFAEYLGQAMGQKIALSFTLMAKKETSPF